MNANLQKYLKYKSKYLDLKNELMGGKNYAELNGGGLTEKQMQDARYLSKIRTEEADERLKNLEREYDRSISSRGNDYFRRAKETEREEAAERAREEERSKREGRTAVRINDIEGITQSRTLPTSIYRGSVPLPRSNALGPVGQYDNAPLQFDAQRGDSPEKSFFNKGVVAVTKFLSPRRADSPSKADSLSRAASDAARRSPSESQRSLQQAPETRQRDDNTYRTARTIRRGSLGEQQASEKRDASRERRQDQYDDANEAGARIGARSRYPELNPELNPESMRIIELYKQNRQKLLDNINKRRSGVDSNKSQMFKSVTQITTMLEKNMSEIEKEIEQEKWFSGLLKKDKHYEDHLNSLIMFINREQINAYINIDNFFNLIEFLKEKYNGDDKIISFLNIIKK
jgi:hypothetical protein